MDLRGGRDRDDGCGRRACKASAASRTFGLIPGQLGSARGRQFEVLGARRSDTWIAIAAFRSDFAGALPFRVREPKLGPSVFELLRRRARPDAPFFQVVVEGDMALRDELVARGARTALRFVHMEGPLGAE